MLDQEQQKESLNKEERVFSALAYVGILCLIPLLFKKESNFAQFHGKQGLVIFFVWIVLWIANIVPFLGQIVWVLGSLVLVLISLLGILHALHGDYWEVPFLGSYAKRLKL